MNNDKIYQPIEDDQLESEVEIKHAYFDGSFNLIKEDNPKTYSRRISYIIENTNNKSIFVKHIRNSIVEKTFGQAIVQGIYSERYKSIVWGDGSLAHSLLLRAEPDISPGFNFHIELTKVGQDKDFKIIVDLNKDSEEITENIEWICKQCKKVLSLFKEYKFSLQLHTTEDKLNPIHINNINLAVQILEGKDGIRSNTSSYLKQNVSESI